MWNKNIRYTLNTELKDHFNLEKLIEVMPITFYKGNGSMCVLVDDNGIITETYAYVVKQKAETRYDALIEAHQGKYKGHKIVYDLNTDENVPVYDMCCNKKISYKFYDRPPDLFEYILAATTKGIVKIYNKAGLASLVQMHQDLSDLIASKPETNIKTLVAAWCKVNNVRIDEYLLKDYELLPEGADLIPNEKFNRLHEIMKKVIHPVKAEIKVEENKLLPPPKETKTVVDKIVDVLLSQQKVFLSDLTLGKYPPISQETIAVELDIPVKECGITKINIRNGLISVFSDLHTITTEEVEDLIGLKNFVLFTRDSLDTFDDGYYGRNWHGY